MFKLCGGERKKKKGIALMLIIAVFMSVNGCGNTGGEGSIGGAASSGGGTGLGASSEAMGRYVEETSDLSNKISGDGSRLFQLTNGNQVISDRLQDFIKTGDNGAIWMTDIRRWRTKMIEEGTYIMNMAIGPDNTVALIYQADVDADGEAFEKTGKKTDGTEEEAAGANEAEEAETRVSDEKADNETEIVLNPQLLIIKPDNTEIPVEIALTEEDQYLDQVYIADGGRIFVTTRGNSNLYEVYEDGSSDLFLMVQEGHPDLIQFQGSYMVMDGYEYDGPVVYDMERKEYIEDDVMTSFVEENYPDRNNSMDSYQLFFFFGEEGIIYLAGEKGLYRHVIGGSAMEQVIDGKLCSLGNPAYELQGMLALENSEFLALFNGCRLVHYVYDPDISTVPGETLKVYGLEDNEVIRQAINLYQTKNPEVYIEFEYGMGGDNSITREDALKSLNTKIVAGEGPDILLLDNMPVDSYVEKGLLLDLSSIIGSLSGEDALFDNIVEAVKTDEAVYAVPCEVKLPVMMGDKKYISQVDDLEDIADMMEALREENPEQDLFGYCSEKGIMRLFAMTCAPSWTMENGEINKEAVREFLLQTGRIYQAQMDGLPDRAVTRYQSIADAYVTYNGVPSFEDSDYVRGSGINKMNYIGGYYSFIFGTFSCMDVNSIQRIDGFENTAWVPMKGQVSHAFWAETLLGINAASEHAGLAEDFLRICLGKENQSYLYDSLAVNKAAFEESFIGKENETDSDGRYGSVATDSDEGELIVLIYYWPTEEETAQYRKYMEEADTAYVQDDMLEEVVYEEGIAYMQGSVSLDDAVSNIEKKVALYMAE